MTEPRQTTDPPSNYRCLDFEANRGCWDEWLRDAANAGGSQVSAHLNSFRPYRAQVSLHVNEDDGGQWLAAVGLISWKVPGIGASFGVGMGGPVGDVRHWPTLLDGLSHWCRRRKWMCVELSPHLAKTNQQASDALNDAGFRPAPIFAPVSGMEADLRVRLYDVNEEQLIRSFRRQTRQHISRSMREGYQLSFPIADDEVQAGIDFLYATSLENGIPFGPLSRFTSAVLDLVRSQTGYLVLVKHGDRLLAGGVLVRAGQSHSCYRLATKRDHEHPRAAYFLQWQSMLHAKRQGAHWYYLTGRSTPSVHQFKRGFRPQEIELMEPQRLVFRPQLMRSIETVQPLAIKTARRMMAVSDRLRGRS